MKISRVILVSLIVVVGLGACTTVRYIFSSGNEELKLAQEVYSKGDGLQAMIHGTNALLTDSTFLKAKVFIRDNFDPIILTAQQQLSNFQSPTNTAEATQAFTFLSKFVKIYSNLEKIGLPITHPNGSFNWTTPIVDYSTRLDTIRKITFNFLKGDARLLMQQNRVNETGNTFRLALESFVVDENIRQLEALSIADELTARATDVLSTRVIEEVVVAHEFYKLALSFVPNHQVAMDGMNKAAAYVAYLYVEHGNELEETRAIDSMLQAASFYKSALRWINEHVDATVSLQRVTEKIAAYYYEQASVAEAGRNYVTALDHYHSVREWNPDFRETAQRYYQLRFDSKVTELDSAIVRSRSLFDEYQRLIERISPLLDRGGKDIDLLNNISSKSIVQNKNLLAIQELLTKFSSLRLVTPVTENLSRQVGVSRLPVALLNNRFENLHKPVLVPLRQVVTDTRQLSQQMASRIRQNGVLYIDERGLAGILRTCLPPINNDSLLNVVEESLNGLIKSYQASSHAMTFVNAGLTKMEIQGLIITGMSGSIIGSNQELDRLNNTVNRTKKTIEELESALKKKYRIAGYGYTARKYLGGITIPVRLVDEEYYKAIQSGLQPILNKLGTELPSLNQLETLSLQLENLRGCQDVLLTELTGVRNALANLTDAELNINTHMGNLEHQLNCISR